MENALLVSIAIFFTFRNIQVFIYKCKQLKLVDKLNKKDIFETYKYLMNTVVSVDFKQIDAAYKESEKRCRQRFKNIESVSYFLMVIQIWKSFDDFYKDIDFIEKYEIKVWQ